MEISLLPSAACLGAAKWANNANHTHLAPTVFHLLESQA